MYNIISRNLKRITIKYMPKSYWLTLAALLVLGIAYLVWLDAGCEVSGVMTWHGKECVQL